MPQPKVSSGPSRSATMISRDGSCRYIKMAKYNPAGPPPITFIFLVPAIQTQLGLSHSTPSACKRPLNKSTACLRARYCADLVSQNLLQFTNDRLERLYVRRQRRVAFDRGRAQADAIIHVLQLRPGFQGFQELQPLRGAQ